MCWMYLNSLSGIYITPTRFILQLFLYIFLKVLGTSWTLRQQFGTIILISVSKEYFYPCFVEIPKMNIRNMIISI